MNPMRNTVLMSMLFGSACLFGQSQPAETNHQDVPTQQAPGTNNPDVGKQRRPAPATPQGGAANTQTSDVPDQQQPGTNNPDVAKQRRDANATGGTDTSGNSAHQSGGKKRGKQKTSHNQT